MIHRLLTQLFGCHGAKAWNRHDFVFLPKKYGFFNPAVAGRWQCRDCGGFKSLVRDTPEETVAYDPSHPTYLDWTFT